MLKMKLPRRSLCYRNAKFLRKLFQAFKRSRQRGFKLIKEASAEQIETLAEATANVLAGKYPKKSKKYITQLRKHRRLLREISSPTLDTETKRHKLVHNQDGRGFFLPLLAPLIGTLLSAVL